MTGLKPSPGIKRFAVILVIYSVFNLLGSSNLSEFKKILQGLPALIIYAVFIFSIGYAIVSIKCALSIIKLEEWARKLSVILVLISLVLGVFLTPITFKNLPAFYDGISKDYSYDIFLKSTIFFVAFATALEMLYVYFFTREKIKKQFRAE